MRMLHVTPCHTAFNCEALGREDLRARPMAVHAPRRNGRLLAFYYELRPPAVRGSTGTASGAPQWRDCDAHPRLLTFEGIFFKEAGISPAAADVERSLVSVGLTYTETNGDPLRFTRAKPALFQFAGCAQLR